ncbi:DUF2927 domain-containing protein [Thioclava pacifica]|uniref:ATP-dependent transcriptional regulator n=1 Tax=Thioclava pacifica DSM 10166 TaxID=1353537 RepID=A0A074J2Q7_9RHOB|nr:DUF2927 domain-containing protein [Thioclava pacifica]KEO51671.1 hypothetical protein TP2_09335 [Thioclava pacifica DSM 10166]
MRITCLPREAVALVPASTEATPRNRRAVTRPEKLVRLLAAVMVTGALSACVPSSPEVTATRGSTELLDLPLVDPVPGLSNPVPAARLPDNSHLGRDFLELSFYLESGRPLPRFTRFEGPVSITLAGNAPPVAQTELNRLVRRLQTEAGLRVSAQPGNANTISVQFVPKSEMRRAVPDVACFVVPNVTSWSDYRGSRGSARSDWTQLTQRHSATVFIPEPATPQEIRDCLHEEVSQALGPVNDLYRLPDTVWNDDNFHTVLTGFDMTILRAYYDPALRSGMSRTEVQAALPAILARINPAGGQMRGLPEDPTPRAYVTAIATALGSGANDTRRRAAARQATQIAAAQGWTDSRAAFAWFALGRLSMKTDPDVAIRSYLNAGAIYARTPGAGIQAAHIDMQLAAFALGTGRAQDAIALVNRSLSPAISGENASLMATLYMIRAEAYAQLGNAAQAEQARLDMEQWARYGFGSDAAVRRRASEVAALADAGARMN